MGRYVETKDKNKKMEVWHWSGLDKKGVGKTGPYLFSFILFCFYHLSLLLPLSYISINLSDLSFGFVTVTGNFGRGGGST